MENKRGNTYDKVDQKVQDALGQYEMPHNESDWLDMEKVLDTMPGKSSFSINFQKIDLSKINKKILFNVLIGILTLSAAYMIFDNIFFSESAPEENTKAIEVPVQDELQPVVPEEVFTDSTQNTSDSLQAVEEEKALVDEIEKDIQQDISDFRTNQKEEKESAKKSEEAPKKEKAEQNATPVLSDSLRKPEETKTEQDKKEVNTNKKTAEKTTVGWEDFVDYGKEEKKEEQNPEEEEKKTKKKRKKDE